MRAGGAISRKIQLAYRTREMTQAKSSDSLAPGGAGAGFELHTSRWREIIHSAVVNIFWCLSLVHVHRNRVGERN